MGKASSSKKVARAARAGAKGSGRRERHLGFPLAVTAIVLLGVAVVVIAVSGREEASAEAPLVNQDHWHAAYALYDCTEERYLPPVQDPNDPAGIHSHADGLIHIHPFAPRVAGANATIGEFFTAVDLGVSEDEIRVPDGPTLSVGDGECDGGDPIVQVGKWDTAATAADQPPDEVITEDFGDIRFLQPDEAYTIAFLPEGEEIPPPNTLSNLARLNPQTEQLDPLPPGETIPQSPDDLTSTTIPAIDGEGDPPADEDTDPEADPEADPDADPEADPDADPAPDGEGDTGDPPSTTAP
ncbi:hypothetical protein BH20ACT2_BH20ACT2_14270 [soil metagenome]